MSGGGEPIYERALKLENLIVSNRERYALRYATHEDQEEFSGDVGDGIIKSDVTKWAFIALEHKPSPRKLSMFLTGCREGGVPILTSYVVAIDTEIKFVRTSSSSLYQLVGAPVECPLSGEYVAGIAAMFNVWGLGQRSE